ncbi:MAG: IS1182 family transposase [Thermodesulfobacteriota bacterium]|jgi:transposase
MMGYESKENQEKLFYYGINLEERIRPDHPLRKIAGLIDFDFIYDEVKEHYGIKSNVSVPPPVILKLMLLLILYNLRSERELMGTIPERLDWLWFLGYDLDDEIPDHSVLSKARSRWGVETFKHFFERIVWQCVETGLVDGAKLFMDSSLIQADASNDSVVNRESLKRYLNQSYRELEARLQEQPEEDLIEGAINQSHVSTTDPEASVVRQGGKAKLYYKVHRAVDGQEEIITATEVTRGQINEAHRLPALIEGHSLNTEKAVETVVADSKYGTVENYLQCYDLGIKAHIPDLKKKQDQTGRREGIFGEEAFAYDPNTDTYRCPAGQMMKIRRHQKKRKAFEYLCAPDVSAVCPLRNQCTRSKTGRSVKRHQRQEELNLMREQAQSKPSQKDLRTRQHLLERTFARATRYGFKRARWRNIWRVQIQEYLTASIQNILILIHHVKERRTAGANRNQKANPKRPLIRLANCFWRGFPFDYLPKPVFIYSCDL